MDPLVGPAVGCAHKALDMQSASTKDQKDPESFIYLNKNSRKVVLKRSIILKTFVLVMAWIRRIMQYLEKQVTSYCGIHRSGERPAHIQLPYLTRLIYFVALD